MVARVDCVSAHRRISSSASVAYSNDHIVAVGMCGAPCAELGQRLRNRHPPSEMPGSPDLLRDRGLPVSGDLRDEPVQLRWPSACESKIHRDVRVRVSCRDPARRPQKADLSAQASWSRTRSDRGPAHSPIARKEIRARAPLSGPSRASDRRVEDLRALCDRIHTTHRWNASLR
jgi:hypothetical protein